MSRNDEIARQFEAFADLLDAKGVEYKPRAYRRAAENIREYPGAVEDLAAEGADALDDIDGVGDAIAAKIVEYVETGRIEELDALREEYPLDMDAITSIEGVGPKTAGRLYEALGVQSLDDLEDKQLVERQVISEKPVRVQYSLTQHGQSLEPVIIAMRDWGMENLAEPSDPESADV